MDPNLILEKLAEHGPILALAVWGLWVKDRQLNREKDARVADAKAYTEMALKLQSSVTDSVHKVAEIIRVIQEGRK